MLGDYSVSARFVGHPTGMYRNAVTARTSQTCLVGMMPSPSYKCRSEGQAQEQFSLVPFRAGPDEFVIGRPMRVSDHRGDLHLAQMSFNAQSSRAAIS